MALFENFPYTNLHELNLDWLIDELKRVQSQSVISVNGMTGDVILYENATVQFPNVPEDHWSMIRMANGTTRGIMFGNDNKAYIVHGNLMAEMYAQNNQPPYPVTSVNGQTGDIVLYAQNTVRLPDLDNIALHSWNIFRELNNNYLGIEFNEDGTACLIFNTQRYNIYSVNNPPPYPVTSVNGQTGDITLFTDNNGVVAFPGIDDPNLAGWIIGRTINNTPCYIQLNDDGTLGVTAGVNSFRVYTTDDTSADVINIPTDAVTDTWGLIRDTSEGSVGILFSNDDQLTQPEAYIRYVDSMDVVHTEKLLTLADIPSAAGVVSFNGMTGVVQVKGSDLIVSTTDTRTIAQAISDGAVTDYAIKGSLAYVENTNTATQNIPEGAYVIWQNAAYISTQAISLGDTLSGTNLTALSGGGITNNLRNDVDTLIAMFSPTLHTVTPATADVEIISGGYYQIGKLVIVALRLDKKISGQVYVYGFPKPAINGNTTFAGYYGTDNEYCQNFFADLNGVEGQLAIATSKTGNTIRISGEYIAE